MCRLYGFAATEPTRLECSLLHAQNALRVQSDRDRGGHRHPDGWGIARWVGDRPSVVRSTKPAFADTSFASEAAATVSRTVIAHVRAASIGPVAHNNVHPFQYGPWAFAHNGTLTAFEQLAPELRAEALGEPMGSTDSELVFRWLLGRMPNFGLDPQEPASGVEPLLRLLEAAVLELVRRSLPYADVAPPRLNFVMSDGEHLVASRWGNTLFWTLRVGRRDCVSCGRSHCPEADDTYRAVVVASEAITDEAWIEVQEGTLLGVDRRVYLTTRDLLSQAA